MRNLLSEKELVKPHIHEILRANYMCIGNLWGKGDGGLSLDGNWNFFIICLAQECKAAVWRGMWDLAAGLGVQVKRHASEDFYCTLAYLGKGSQPWQLGGAGCSNISVLPHDLFAQMHREESFPNNIFIFLSHSPQTGPKSHPSVETWSRFLLEGGNPSLHQAVTRKFNFLAFDLLSAFATEANGWLFPLHHRPNSRPGPEAVKTRAGFCAGAKRGSKGKVPAAGPAVRAGREAFHSGEMSLSKFCGDFSHKDARGSPHQISASCPHLPAARAPPAAEFIFPRCCPGHVGRRDAGQPCPSRGEPGQASSRQRFLPKLRAVPGVPLISAAPRSPRTRGIARVAPAAAAARPGPRHINQH